MKWLLWEPFYVELAKDMKLDSSKDYEVASKFHNLLKAHKPQGYESILQHIKSFPKQRAWIVGAGPSLEKDFRTFEEHYSTETDVVIGVDGACLFLQEQGYYPDIIFSDLDGSIPAIELCLEHGSILVLHAHGDNYDLVEKYFPTFRKHVVLGTVQTKPSELYVYNFGGFTDGDRAIAAVLAWFISIKVLLIGFTFGTIQGRYSKPEKLSSHAQASEFKLQKLLFAKNFIAVLAKNYPNQIYNLSRPTETIQGVAETYPAEL